MHPRAETSPGTARVVRFGAFDLDLISGELHKSGLRVRLQEKPAQLLALLLERPGELVTREEIREKLWNGYTAFDFDHSLGSAANRLRATLGDSAANPRFVETVPRRGFRFIAPVEEASGPAAGDARFQRYRLPALLVILAVGALVAVRSVSDAPGIPPASQISPILSRLTTLPGEEWYPKFSPDGSMVAFTHKAEGGADYDFYIQEIGMDAPVLRVGTSRNEDTGSWLPDGRSLVFARPLQPRTALFRIPTLGGVERKLLDCRLPSQEMEVKTLIGPWCNLSPDGRWLVTVHRETEAEPYGLFAVSMDSLERHRLTGPPETSLGDVSPVVSPNGDLIAFHRMVNPALSEIFLLRVSPEFEAIGEPRQLTSDGALAASPTWTSDGREIVYSAGLAQRHYPDLRRVSISGDSPSRPVASAGRGAFHPSISREGKRLAYSQISWIADIWQLELERGGVAAGEPEELIASTGIDAEPQLSPDGRRIVFSSERSGTREIWVCDQDGSNLVKLTSTPTGFEFAPRWSPDGEWIAYTSDPGGNRDIHLIGLDGGDPRRVTDSSADDNTPAWSSDGGWLYFASNRSGSYEIWKTPLDATDVTQVTHQGGARPRLDPTGKHIYYAKRHTVPFSVWRIPVDGGEEVEILDESREVDEFTVGRDGIFFTSVSERNGSRYLHFHEESTQTVRTVAKLSDSSMQCAVCSDWLEFGLSLSGDGRRLLYGQVEGFGSDVMLVENFR